MIESAARACRWMSAAVRPFESVAEVDDDEELDPPPADWSPEFELCAFCTVDVDDEDVPSRTASICAARVEVSVPALSAFCRIVSICDFWSSVRPLELLGGGGGGGGGAPSAWSDCRSDCSVDCWLVVRTASIWVSTSLGDRPCVWAFSRIDWICDF